MSTSPFRPYSHYVPATGDGYQILPFRFMRYEKETVLCVNEVGEYLFLDGGTFQDFTTRQLSCDSQSYFDLKAKHFLMDSSSTVPIELLATKYRTKKSFLEGFTRLHIFVVTLRCDHSCAYCQVSRVTEDRRAYDMSQATALRAIQLMFRSPSPALKVEFQGGEPLLNFDLIRFVVAQVEERNKAEKREIQFVVATNLSPLTDDMLSFFHDHEVFLSTSLDGPPFVHNANRPRRGNDSYEITVKNLKRARVVLGHDRVAAIMTTTALSLNHPREIVDEYIRQDFDSIFLRPISPYGFAARGSSDAAYASDRFLEFYKAALSYIVDLNRRGQRFLEVFTQICVRKILTPFATGYVDLQSPAGAGVSVVAYNYDGDVYASDEARMLAEMKDFSFRLGNVHANSYEEIFGSETLRAVINASCVEALPGCCECAFAPYCGSDPVFHWTTQNDLVGHRPTSAFCSKNIAIFRHLFSLLHSEDRFVMALFTSWATHRPLSAPSHEREE